MALLSELNIQLLSSNRIKLLLLATPIVIGSGICLYYYYSKSSQTARKKKNPPKSKREADKSQSISGPLKKALDLKNKGNDLFRDGNYEGAIKLYSEAISVSPSNKPKDLSTFYQNRAACYEHLEQYDDVIADCSKAIEYDKQYIKAYLRRGKAFEIINNYEKAAQDFYIASVSTQFQNSDYMKLLYDVLDKFSSNKAHEIIAKRKGCTFQKYLFKHLLNKFSRDPLKKKKNEILGDYENYFNRILRDDVDDDNLSIDDLLFKATVEMYIGRHETGQIKLRKIIETSPDKDYKVNSLLKLAEFYFQNNKLEDAESCLKDAEMIDPENADLYYIRSQLHIINKNNEESIKDLNKCIELDPNFPCAIGQKLYIEYQNHMMLNNFVGKGRVINDFEKTLEKFPTSNELLILYFQIVLSNGEIKQAENYIMKALQNEPDDPTLYVYRALVFIEDGQLDKTKEFLDQALKLDSRCSFAYDMLSDLCSKLDNQKEAINYLENAINSSTTYEDVKNLILKQKSIELQINASSITG